MASRSALTKLPTATAMPSQSRAEQPDAEAEREQDDFSDGHQEWLKHQEHIARRCCSGRIGEVDAGVVAAVCGVGTNVELVAA